MLQDYLATLLFQTGDKSSTISETADTIEATPSASHIDQLSEKEAEDLLLQALDDMNF